MKFIDRRRSLTVCFSPVPEFFDLVCPQWWVGCYKALLFLDLGSSWDHFHSTADAILNVNQNSFKIYKNFLKIKIRILFTHILGKPGFSYYFVLEFWENQVFVPNTKVTGCIFSLVVGGVVWITIPTTAIFVIAFSAYIFRQSRLNTSAFAEIPNLPNLWKLWEDSSSYL